MVRVDGQRLRRKGLGPESKVIIGLSIEYLRIRAYKDTYTRSGAHGT